ncbi:MAG: hypothetical protein CMK83_18840 [Pseudomonadales bacterium]|jgi:VanZ family protein|uniref:VanZ family protein n=1 Tax=unclassified Ketobacter TaxID=2639109 RepID=UPI000C984AF8|nr:MULTISPECIES: VanZ family protein [unclassified Ketobacter]MAQ26267.1 hypothetical protein [Pseudomonadales bacterium]MEC8809957.1 VanZ family protein [Pseudomonadota bacterium]TNC90383.1 MAG: hypothetical protein CSH49_03350 [Alcanivorax sp.]HAG96549.1 hypothetical protein [Gammaproteobacteria bacterium]RLT89915.1 MAG: VanZ family protein [Ketobacter sp. GenoA1]|tara:strand:+ start:415 stop:798 length:384 start_codon:yes stop_codon:yes gene_type:complete
MLPIPLQSHQITWFFRLALLLNLLAISWLAFSARPLMIMPDMLSDKIHHFIAFFVLAYCLDAGFPKRRFLVYKLVPLLFYGIAIELIQSRIPNRDVSGLDLLADALAIVSYWLIRQPMRKLLVPAKP